MIKYKEGSLNLTFGTKENEKPIQCKALGSYD